jgi:hypothetical protein
MDAIIIIGLIIMVVIFWTGWKKTHSSKKSDSPTSTGGNSTGGNSGSGNSVGDDLPNWPEKPIENPRPPKPKDFM